VRKEGSKISRSDRTQKDDAASGLSSNLITILHPASAASEAYRTLRTSLLYSRVDAPPKVILVTSAGPREGKSTVCANLSVVLAQSHKNTLVVDCDLRRPALHQLFGLRNIWGLASILLGERGLHEVCSDVLPGLKFAAAGPIPPDPAEVLGSRRFAEFLAEVRESFDHVLIDCPPVQAVSDPLILAAQADGVLLVMDVQETRKMPFAQAIRKLDAVGAVVLGAVVNNVEVNKKSYSYGSSGYPY
jgi:capsular exopolysaccharide synthesis family protein